MNGGRRLREEVERDARRLNEAGQRRRSVLAQARFLGTLGLVMVLPMVAGAYLGRWLDERLPGYSQSWTLSLLLLGVLVGAVNVYLMLRD
ncbi:MAG TPA: AtpZ/AtpI family protein [Roseiflexaceae bacterium]|nr:AtpZ/AtpI family protein [Roseiflexaceae bacterium]